MAVAFPLLASSEVSLSSDRGGVETPGETDFVVARSDVAAKLVGGVAIAV
jgi:hypothetical protein